MTASWLIVEITRSTFCIALASTVSLRREMRCFTRSFMASHWRSNMRLTPSTVSVTTPIGCRELVRLTRSACLRMVRSSCASSIKFMPPATRACSLSRSNLPRAVHSFILT